VLVHNFSTMIEALAVRKQLHPFEPDLHRDRTLDDDKVILMLGTKGYVFSEIDVALGAECSEKGQEFGSMMQSAGMNTDGLKICYCPTPLISYSRSHRFAGDMLRMLAVQKGVTHQTLLRNDNEKNIQLYLPKIGGDSLLPAERFHVSIITDDTNVGHVLMEKLAASGFTNISVSHSPSTLHTFELFPGPLSFPRFSMTLSNLKNEVMTLLEHYQVNAVSHPLNEIGIDDESFASDTDIKIHMPISQYQRGELRAYAGDLKQRMEIKLLSDDEECARTLAELIENAGFNCPSIEIQQLDDAHFGVASDDVNDMPLTVNELRTLVQNHMQALHVPTDFKLTENKPNTSQDIQSILSKDEALTIVFPINGVFDGSKLKKFNNPKNFKIKLISPHSDQLMILSEKLVKQGYRKPRFDHSENHNELSIRYGGAPLGLLEELSELCKTQWQSTDTVSLKKDWDDNDKDIYITLPDYPENQRLEALQPSVIDCPYPAIGVDRPFLYKDHDTLTIGELKLPIHRAGDKLFVPKLKHYHHFCVDQQSAENLRFISQAIVLNEPCYLIGPTATSKTASIFFLAALLGQPVMRFNFSNQTDVTDLMGRFVPVEGTLSQKELEGNLSSLSIKTRKIMECANAENRILTPFELNKITCLCTWLRPISQAHELLLSLTIG
jgi:hypothetical protein